MNICKAHNHSKYIGYQCVICSKNINEEERQKIISLHLFQTWCILCLIKKYPADKLLQEYAKTNGKNDSIIDRNQILN